MLRFVTLLILVVNVVLIPYDRSRFDADRFQVALLLRLVVVVPLCVAIIAYTYSRLFVRRPDLLALPALLLGTVIIAYSVIGKDPGYGTLAVLFVYLYWCVQSGGLYVYAHPLRRRARVPCVGRCARLAMGPHCRCCPPVPQCWGRNCVCIVCASVVFRER